MFGATSDDVRALLKDTLAHAARVPLYAQRWSSTSWSRIPLLDKDTAAEHQQQLRSSSAPSASVGTVSSSTTREGRPLRVLRHAAGAQPPADRIRVVRVYAPRHGGRVDVDGDELNLAATLHAGFVDLLLDVLREHRPTELVIPLSTLKWVTVAIAERGLAADLEGLGLSVISVTGYQLTTSSRAWLTTAWRVPLVDDWSMSELVGHTTPCAMCGAAHWTGAPLFAELVRPNSGKRLAIDTGVVGELVVTTVLPHGAAMPLIRYRTGDIVEAGRSCRAHGGRRGLGFRGRIVHSAIVNDVVVAASNDLLELGEGRADIAQVPHPAEVLGLIPVADIGVPKVRASVVGHRAVVDVEVRFDPARFAAAARDVAAAVSAVVGANVDVVVHRPGSLDLLKLARKL